MVESENRLQLGLVEDWAVRRENSQLRLHSSGGRQMHTHTHAQRGREKTVFSGHGRAQGVRLVGIFFVLFCFLSDTQQDMERDGGKNGGC